MELTDQTHTGAVNPMWPFADRRRWYPPVFRALFVALGAYLVAWLFAALVSRQHRAAAPKKPSEPK